jgi:two-component system, chemotaxis family, protein-glutamate methylesterase/glutaminase
MSIYVNNSESRLQGLPELKRRSQLYSYRLTPDHRGQACAFELNIIWVKPDSPLGAEASEFLLKNRIIVGFGRPNYRCMLFNELLQSCPFHLIILDSKPPVDFDRSHGEHGKKFAVEYFFLDEHIKVQRRISEISSNTSKYTRSAKQKLKILFVDDEVEICNLHSESLKNSGFDVQTCHDGSSAIELLKQKKFDLLVTDYSMPKVNGSILIRNAFQIQPSIKCILISDYLDEAADLGLEKPVIRINKPFSFQLLLTSCLRSLGTLVPKYDAKLIRASKPSLVAIGASTGGPNALNFLLKNLSGSSVPIVIVRHMSEHFHDQFYIDLVRLTKLQLKYVETSTTLLPGTIYAAAKNSHIEVIERQGVLIGRKGAGLPVHGMCPAIDPLFASLATNIKQTILAVLMTGMGHDGADGLKLMKEAGHTTVIQDEASCVVYGMPKSAANINAALMEASLEQIKQILHVYCTFDNSPDSSK